jgi:hypothetical protein
MAVVAPMRAAAAPVRLIDAFIANDEIAFIRYRLHAHENLTQRVIIAEANVSITRAPKPWHVTAALTSEEIRRFNIRLLHIPFTLHRAAASGREYAEYAPVDEGSHETRGAHKSRAPRHLAGFMAGSSYFPSAAAYNLRPSPQRMMLESHLARQVRDGQGDDKEINDGMRFGLSLAVRSLPSRTPQQYIHTYNAHISDAAAPASLLLLISQFVPPSSAIPIRDARAIPPAPSFPIPFFATPATPTTPLPRATLPTLSAPFFRCSRSSRGCLPPLGARRPLPQPSYTSPTSTRSSTCRRSSAAWQEPPRSR